jgi:MacB-like periplasmic core domain
MTMPHELGTFADAERSKSLMNSLDTQFVKNVQKWLPDLALGIENLSTHKLRSLLTMLGMIFGVAAVVAMLSIGAGAQQKVMAFIEQLGVRN